MTNSELKSKIKEIVYHEQDVDRLLSLFSETMESIIGEKEREELGKHYDSNKVRNHLREEQKAKLNKIIGK